MALGEIRAQMIPACVRLVMDILERNGYEAYIVGGCVRDFLMGREPHDFDVTTNASPEQMKVCFKGMRLIETGIKHGTLTVAIDGENVEITTYRIDGKYTDGRHPESVTFTTRLEDDLSRRDFTVNAMAYSPKRGLVDAFGGVSDLENRIIRCVGDPDARFNEDGLRIIRALRFSSVLDFDIEDGTSAAALRNAGLLRGISVERIYTEFTKLLLGVRAGMILRRYRSVIEVFLPQLLRCDDVEYSVAVRTVDGCDLSPAERYAALLGVSFDTSLMTCDTTPIEEGLACLKSDIRTRKETIGCYRAACSLGGDDARAARRAIRQFTHSTLDSAIAMTLALLYAQGDIGGAERLKKFRALADAESSRPDACFTLKALNIDGRALITLGAKGELIGQVLERLLDEVVDGLLANEENALLERARTLIERGKA